MSLNSRPLPPGWTRGRWAQWEARVPPGWVPRIQGWKIHVSSTLSDYRECLDLVSAVCEQMTASFKYLRTFSEFCQANAKHADRLSSGKFITVYPDSDEQLSALTAALEAAIGHLPGPFVLTDVRHRNTPIFFRYGAIVPVQRYSGADEALSSIADPHTGRLMSDPRTLGFTYPNGVAAPPEVRAAVAAHGAGDPTALDDFAAISPIWFSNAGGVYRAEREGQPEPRLLREARPFAGIDARKRDAVTRLEHETVVLTELQGSPYVQRCYGRFTAWEHHYLELEYLPGANLQKWPVHHCPPRRDPVADREYAQRCRHLVDLLTAAVEDVHSRGWCLGDLHPGNVIVAPDESRLWLIDLEDATRVGEPRAVGMRVIDYCAPDGRSAVEADWYAVARMAMSLYVAEWAITMLAPQYWDVCLDRVARRFGEACRDQVRELANRGEPTSGLPHTLTPTVVPRPVCKDPAVVAALHDDRVVWRRLVAGIVAARKYGDARHFPGDRSTSVVDAYTVNSGLAGVLLALNRLGEPVETVDHERLVVAGHLWPQARAYGLYQGLAGLAVTLHELGDRDEALRAAHTALNSAVGANRCDLFGGLAGTALAALLIGREAGDERLVDAACTAYRDLNGRLSCERRDFFTTPLNRRTGLYHGWSGIALLDLVMHATVGDDRALDAARERIRLDLAQCITTRNGCLAAHDREKNRSLPYLEWGSAGILTAAGLYEQRSARSCLTPEQEAGLVRACSATTYVYSHLNHGRAGIVVGLRALPARAADAALVDVQLAAVKDHLVSLDADLCVVGENMVRLSTDFGTGAAGVALVLAHDTVGALGYLPVPGLSGVLEPAPEPPGVCVPVS